MFLVFGTCFILDYYKVFLDSRIEVFWILRSVFGFWKCFWNLGSISEFMKSFWILRGVLDSGKCFWILGRVLNSGTCFVPTSHRMFVIG